MSEKRKIVLVGTGFVGMSMAYSFLNTGGIDELVLIAKEKAVGEAMDLQHGLPYARGKMEIYAGDYADCRDASIVVITAGAAQKPEETRLDLTAKNAKIMKSVVESIMASGFDGILIIASNPVDGMTYLAQKVSGHQQYSRVYHGRAWRFQLCSVDTCLCRKQITAGAAG